MIFADDSFFISTGSHAVSVEAASHWCTSQILLISFRANVLIFGVVTRQEIASLTNVSITKLA